MKRIGLICLALVFALGGLGVAYAAWTDDVTITQTVETGELCVGVRDVGTNDDPGDTDGVANSDGTGYDKDPGAYWIGSGWRLTFGDKDVASATSANGTAKCVKGGVQYFDSVTETISNAYPSYAPRIELEFANCGSIPVDVFWSTTASGDVELAPFVHIIWWQVYKNGAYVNSGYTNQGLLDFFAGGFQVDPCDVITLKLTKHILQEQGGVEAPQGKTVTLTHTVTAIQWNIQ